MKKNTRLYINRTKIFNNNLNNNIKIIHLNPRYSGITKYLPSFSKEWKDIIYCFNKNNIKNLPSNRLNINKIIKSYFNLFFKKPKFLRYTRNIILRKRRKLLRRIFVSNAEIKHTNNKSKITLYTMNREKENLREKYLQALYLITTKLYIRYRNVYKHRLNTFFLIKNNEVYNKLNELSGDDFYTKSENKTRIENFVNKKVYINHKLIYIYIVKKLYNLSLKKVWSLSLKNQSKKFKRILRKYNLLYSLNQFKFNKLTLLPKLSFMLKKIIGKKIEYNIIDLKSILYSTDILTEVMALKIKKIKKGHVDIMSNILNRAHFPIVNAQGDRHKTKMDNINTTYFKTNKYRDLKLLSNLNNSNLTRIQISNLLNDVYKYTSPYNNLKDSSLSSLIYNLINYKNLVGIRLEVKGRLTKRYRADRSVYALRVKGSLKNIDSSYLGLSTTLFRGNTNSNVNYSMATSKRRIGAFAVKGWIGTM